MVRVVAGRTGATLLALDQIDGRRHPGRLVAGGAEDDGGRPARGQLGGGGAAIEGQGVHPWLSSTRPTAPVVRSPKARTMPALRRSSPHTTVTTSSVLPGGEGGQLVGPTLS